MSKILKMLFGLLVLGMAACTTEDEVLQTLEPQDNLLQVPVFSRAALASSATIVGLDAQGNQEFSWNLTDPQPEVDNNEWTSTDPAPSLTGVSQIACLVPSRQVNGKTVTITSLDNNEVLQWGMMPVSAQAADKRFYINLDYKLATICVELDFSRSNITVFHRTGGVFDLVTGEFTSLSGTSKSVSLTNRDGKYTATFSVVPQKFQKGDVLLRYSTGEGGRTFIFKADKNYDLKAGQTLHIHAYQNSDGWSSSYNPISVTGVTLNPTELTLDKGKTFQLRATVSPSNATNKSVTWSSSDTKVVTVDAKGVVTAVAPGVATVTVKTNNGKTATCQVVVNSAVSDWEDESGQGSLTPKV